METLIIIPEIRQILKSWIKTNQPIANPLSASITFDPPQQAYRTQTNTNKKDIKASNAQEKPASELEPSFRERHTQSARCFNDICKLNRKGGKRPADPEIAKTNKTR